MHLVLESSQVLKTWCWCQKCKISTGGLYVHLHLSHPFLIDRFIEQFQLSQPEAVCNALQLTMTVGT